MITSEELHKLQSYATFINIDRFELVKYVKQLDLLDFSNIDYDRDGLRRKLTSITIYKYKKCFDTTIEFQDIAQESLLIIIQHLSKDRLFPITCYLDGRLSRYIRNIGVGYVSFSYKERHEKDGFKQVRRVEMNDNIKLEYVSMLERFVEFKTDIGRLSLKELASILLLNMGMKVPDAQEVIECIGRMLGTDKYQVSRQCLYNWSKEKQITYSWE